MYDRSEYNAAETHFVEVLDSARQISDTLLIAQAQKWLGNVQLAYQVLDKALERYDRSLQLLDTLIANADANQASVPAMVYVERKNVLNNIGTVYIEQGEFDEAEEYLNEVLTQDRNSGDALAIAISLYNLGSWQYRKTIAEDTAADDGVQRAIEYFRESLTTYPTGDAHYNLALAFAYSENLDSAVTHLNQALELYERDGYRNQQSLTLGNMGVINYRRGNLVESIPSLREAIRIIEELRSNVSSVDVRTSFISNKHYLYEYMIAALVDSGLIAEGFEYVERAKARSFLDLLGNKAIGESKSRSPELQRLIDQESAVQERMASIINNPDSSSTYLDLLETQQELIADIQLLDPEYVSVKTIDPASVQELQSLLDDSTVLIEYFVGQYSSYVFLVSRDTVVARPLKLGSRQGFEQRIEKLRRQLYYEFPRKKMGFIREARIQKDMTTQEALAAWREEPTDATWQYQLLTLYSQLVQPVDEFIGDAEFVYIVPHGALHHLPFQALIARPSNLDKVKSHIPRPRFWIEDVAIAYLPSASVLKFARNRTGRNNEDALIIGDPAYADPQYRRRPLPGALVEADSVAAFVQDPLVLKREEAEESVVKAKIGSQSLVHFATHGELNKKDPLNSRILLASATPEGQNDGDLTVSEVFNLDMNASLVTLSACQTAQLASEGGFSAGDDLVGLTRSFLYAGTPSVIASLWYVDDKATLAWMVNFYDGWLMHRKSKVEAARYAALTLLNNPADPDWVFPYYWSAFVFIGDWEQSAR